MNNEKRFNWYEEDFTSFLLSLKLPVCRHDMYLDEVIRKEKLEFYSEVKKVELC